MKNTLAFFLLLFSATLFAQDITGPWHGLLTFPGGQLRITVNIAKNDAGAYTATMLVPEQSDKPIPAETVLFENNIFAFTIPMAGIDYRGTLENNVFKGTFTQNRQGIPLDFGREEVVLKAKVRPQEPAKPYPYHTEDVTFKNEKAGITLAGTLALPKKEGNFPAVILITGSGPQNRDSEILDHKPFLVLADHLTRAGIAVLRYDDRGVGKSEGKFSKATTEDFATDTEAAFQYLKTRKEINKNKIGVLGHSEGGIIAPLVASQHPDVAFVVMLAGVAIPGDELMLLQNYMMGKANGMPEDELTKLGAINRQLYDAIKAENQPNTLKAKLYTIFDQQLKPIFISKGIPKDQVGQYIDIQVAEMGSAWYSNFIRNNPTPVLEKVQCPILALNGDKDLQVAPTANLDAVKRAAQKSGNKKVTTKVLPGLNHLFQESATGAPSEYGELEQTFSPVALKEVTDWMVKVVR
ncbi:alpha/beta hydrolase [Flavobacterium sp. MFBS3-15]|uniref:alpha/beta hydrolase family protein n=1 Tax=Flavobacterium sp. MFBS3-15 TaxID=2989816 RepID=UPI00223643F6|nr:alpha/beta hydrolase [Flavobacterium sp. MFBS3-15]MCW4470552.1 alpha/beta hydrolase [Flavobacterium sp. MFBS3-15]